MHHRSGTLKSPFTLSRNRVTAKNWSQCLHYLQSYLQIFIIHFTAAVSAVPLLQNDNVPLIYPYIIKIWPVWMAYS